MLRSTNITKGRIIVGQSALNRAKSIIGNRRDIALNAGDSDSVAAFDKAIDAMKMVEKCLKSALESA